MNKESLEYIKYLYEKTGLYEYAVKLKLLDAKARLF